MVKQTLTNIRSIKHMTFGLILIILILNHQPIVVGSSEHRTHDTSLFPSHRRSEPNLIGIFNDQKGTLSPVQDIKSRVSGRRRVSQEVDDVIHSIHDLDGHRFKSAKWSPENQGTYPKQNSMSSPIPPLPPRPAALHEIACRLVALPSKERSPEELSEIFKSPSQRRRIESFDLGPVHTYDRALLQQRTQLLNERFRSRYDSVHLV